MAPHSNHPHSQLAMSEETNGKGIPEEYDPFQVNLPIFDGPLDLLLHLVRKQQLDVNELRLAELTEPYLEYLEQMKEFNLDQAGEFLAIASTLVWIKSKTLLPREFQDDEPDPETVEELLLLRLQEYQKIKEAAHELTDMELLGRDVFPRSVMQESPPRGVDDPVFEEVSLFALIEAFREVLEQAESDNTLHIIPEQERVEDKLREMLNKLAREKTVYFQELISGVAGRGEIVLAFIALLELVRLKAVRIVQDRRGGEIFCRVSDAFADAGVDLISSVVGALLGEQEEGGISTAVSDS